MYQEQNVGFPPRPGETCVMSAVFRGGGRGLVPSCEVRCEQQPCSARRGASWGQHGSQSCVLCSGHQSDPSAGQEWHSLPSPRDSGHTCMQRPSGASL